MLDFRLRTFITLCKILSYTKTAQVLHITQPAVSQHIKYLELEYGVKLFKLEGKNLSLTREGEILYDFVIGILSSVEKTKLMMSSPMDSAPTLNFGTTLTIGEYTMPYIIKQLLNDFPNIKIKMIVENTETLLGKLHNGDIDFALLEGHFDKSKYNSLLVSLENFIGVCSSKHEFAKDNVSFNEIFKERIILREKGSGTREIFEQILLEHNLTMNSFEKIIEVGNINAIKDIVTNNYGITFLYKEAVKKELMEGTLSKIDISDFDVVREFNFVYLKSSLHGEEYESWYHYLIKNRA